MRCENRLAIRLLTAGLSLAWVGGSALGQDKPPAQPGGPPPLPRPERPEGAPPPPPHPGGPEGRQRGPGAPDGRERGPGPGVRVDPQRMTERMRERLEGLNLSSEQRTKIDGILAQAKKDLEAAVGDNAGPPRGEGPDKVREVMRSTHEKVMDALDETQREKLRETMRPGPGAREGGGGGPGRFEGGRGPGEGPGRPDGFRGPGGQPERRAPGMTMERLKDNLDKLELSAEQKQKVEALLADSRKKISDLQTEAEKAQADMRGKLRETMESNRDRLNEILTDEQRQKLRELMPPPSRPPGEAGPGPRGEGGEGPRREGRPRREGGPPPPGGPRPEGGPPPVPPRE